MTGDPCSKSGVHRKHSLSLEGLIADLKGRGDFGKAGAVGVFIGVVRENAGRGRTVRKLELEAYEEKADEVLEAICCDLKKKHGIIDVQIHHLLGVFKPGEDLVYVLVAGSHRKSVFVALEEAVERYKHEAPIFKREYFVGRSGKQRSRWVAEDRRTERASRAAL